MFLLASLQGIVYLLATAGMSGAVLILVVMQAVLVAGFVVMVGLLDRRSHIHAFVGRLLFFGAVSAFVLGVSSTSS